MVTDVSRERREGAVAMPGMGCDLLGPAASPLLRDVLMHLSSRGLGRLFRLRGGACSARGLFVAGYTPVSCRPNTGF